LHDATIEPARENSHKLSAVPRPPVARFFALVAQFTTQVRAFLTDISAVLLRCSGAEFSGCKTGQDEPAYCGLGTLAMALNTLQIDPGRVWKGVWRWYDESLLDCCKELALVQQEGITLDEFVCLARCNGCNAALTRTGAGAAGSVDSFRRCVAEVCAGRDAVLACSYSRKTLGQTGDGHFSPIGGYNMERDLVLLLDVARFKYPPHWVPLELCYEAMTAVDKATGQSRGWVVLSVTSTAPDAKGLPHLCNCSGAEANMGEAVMGRITGGQAPIGSATAAADVDDGRRESWIRVGICAVCTVAGAWQVWSARR
jgi:glutathione gamma-glutamylcysteinyltransferase